MNHSGICWIQPGERRYFHRNQHLQQRGRVTNAPEMVSSAAETTGCCSASESKRSLTL